MVPQGWEGPAGALSCKVRVTCVAAARGDLKDSHLIGPIPSGCSHSLGWFPLPPPQGEERED